MSGEVDVIYVQARRTLLDALDALAPHRQALILVGAQAIYLHAGEADLAVAPYTTDGDLAVDPSALGPEPLLEEAMKRAGFRLHQPPGLWRNAHDVQIDLLVPEAVGGAGSRGARLGLHGSLAARKARGLEAALVDRADQRIGALDAGDARAHQVAVAGPAALLVAKLHKLAERIAQPQRLSAKDALDVLRLLRGVPLEKLSAALGRLKQNPLSKETTQQALVQLHELFGKRTAPGAALAGQAVEGIDDPATIAASCVVLASDLLMLCSRAQ